MPRSAAAVDQYRSNRSIERILHRDLLEPIPLGEFHSGLLGEPRLWVAINHVGQLQGPFHVAPATLDGAGASGFFGNTNGVTHPLVDLHSATRKCW